MGQIKKLPLKDYRDYIEIIANAYPGIGLKTDKDKENFTKRTINIGKDDTIASYFGYYRKGKLLAAIRFFDFTMTLFSTKVMCGGGGMLAVDLMYKKEKVCKEIMDFFLELYLKKGAPIIALYPFRPDFYRRMGFGYGTKINLYSIKSGDLPAGGDKKNVRFLTKKDWPLYLKCYNRYAGKRHGMLQKGKYEKRLTFSPETKIAGYIKGGKLLGYIIFSFKTGADDNFFDYTMTIYQIFYETREAHLALLTFLKTQADQVELINYSTQDNDFHFIPFDPRNHTGRVIGILSQETNTQGVGIMYRVIDTPGLFKALKKHNFGNQTCRLKININDNFLKPNNKSFIVHFNKGRALLRNKDDSEVNITLNVAEFSSMIMGVIEFKKLYNYNLAEISDTKYIETINRLFRAEEKPRTTTLF